MAEKLTRERPGYRHGAGRAVACFMTGDHRRQPDAGQGCLIGHMPGTRDAVRLPVISGTVSGPEDPACFTSFRPASLVYTREPSISGYIFSSLCKRAGVALRIIGGLPDPGSRLMRYPVHLGLAGRCGPELFESLITLPAGPAPPRLPIMVYIAVSAWS